MRNEDYRDLAYNGSGYYDKTAYEAFKNITREEKTMKNNSMREMREITPQRGEIWTVDSPSGVQREILVLAAYGTYAAALTLHDNPTSEHSIMIQSRSLKYTDTGKLGYFFYDMAREYIKTLSDPAMERITRAVAVTLGIQAKQEQPVSEAELKAKAVMERKAQPGSPNTDDKTKARDAQKQLLQLQIENAKLEQERDTYKELLYRAVPQIALEPV